jgi:hypothetical protein
MINHIKQNHLLLWSLVLLLITCLSLSIWLVSLFDNPPDFALNAVVYINDHLNVIPEWTPQVLSNDPWYGHQLNKFCAGVISDPNDFRNPEYAKYWPKVKYIVYDSNGEPKTWLEKVLWNISFEVHDFGPFYWNSFPDWPIVYKEGTVTIYEVK